MSLSLRDNFDPGRDGEGRYLALKEMGDCYAALADGQRARECYRRASALAPGRPDPYVGLGVVAMQDGRLDEAVTFFDLARKIDPSCGEAYGGLAMIHQRRQEYLAAFEMYLKCLELNSDNLTALLGLFQTSCQMGTFSKIIRYLEIYLQGHGDDAAVLFCLATLYAREGQLHQARCAVLRVLQLEPGKVEATDLLAQIERAIEQNCMQGV